jgi:hypothetical protein
MFEDRVAGQGGARRRVPRRSFGAKVGLLCEGQYCICTATEIGEGGMMITDVTLPLADGQGVVVTFRMPSDQYLVIRGRVRYSLSGERVLEDSHKHGIQFENIDFKSRREIRGYVASMSSADSVRKEADTEKAGS